MGATTHYTRSEGASIAYRVDGDADLVLLSVPGAISNLALDDASPLMLRYVERLSRFVRVVRFDKRGTGLSDRGGIPLTLKDQVPDVEAVRAAVGAERVALLGLSQGAAVAVLYALAHPQRVSHLVLFEGVCCDRWDPYDDRGGPLLDWEDFFRDLEHDFEGFSARFSEMCFPGAPLDQRSLLTEYLRATASPSSFEALWRGILELDLRPQLCQIAAPTLVLHAVGDRHHPVQHGRYLAEHIPGARLVELESDLHVPIFDEDVMDLIPAAIEEHLTGDVRHAAKRRFATLMFTDIVDSTTEQRKRGDESWRTLLESHAADAERIVAQFGGRVVEIQGDGTLAEFPVPGEALRAALALGAATRDLGVHIRAGLHAGEVQESGGRLFGICVNTAARVAACAGADEVLTTDVVRSLVEGSTFSFADAGEHDLKGIGPRHLVNVLHP